MTIDLTSRTAMVTGAGAGLGRAHALALARYGARIIVNDLSHDAAEAVASEIRDAGGEAIPASASVTDMAEIAGIVADAEARWGGVDILVNNAGVLRDRTFGKMAIEDFRFVLDVHLMGSVNCTKAVRDGMSARGYGRIIFTTSSSGLYGNFGQASYAAAKMGLVGLMQTLALEGARKGIRVNCLAPSASTGMTDALYGAEALARLGPALVSPAIVALASEAAPTRCILLAGGGSFEQAHVTMTRGIVVEEPDAASAILARLDEIGAREGETVPGSGGEQYLYEAARAQAAALL